MKQKTVKSEKQLYVCGACGYDSEFKSYVEEHETKHGRSDPFEVGMEVRYITEEQGSDHGKPYSYGQEHQGIIVRFEDHDPRYGDDEQFDDGRYALVESGRGSRDWIGEYELTEYNPAANAQRKIDEQTEAHQKLVEGWDEKNNNRQNQGYTSYSASSDI